MAENKVNRARRVLKNPPKADRENLSPYSEFLNGIPVSLVILSIPGLKILAVNDQFLIRNAVTREEVIGSPVLKLRWKDPAKAEKAFQTLLKQGTILNVELQVCSQSGKLVTILLHGKRLSLGGRDYLLTTGVNIDKRKWAEAALEDSDSRFRGFEDILPVLTFETNLIGEVIYFNKLAYNLLGYPQDEVIGQPLFNFVAPEDRGRAASSTKRILAGEHLGNDEYTLIAKDGSRLSVIVQAAPVRNIREKLTGMRGIAVNISHQKKIENELRETEAFSAGLFMNSPNPEIVVNPDDTVRAVNPAFEDLTGFSSREIVGLKVPFPWWPREKYEEYREMADYGDQSADFTGERYYRRKNGEIFWVVLNNKRIVEKGQPKYSISTWVNITERKKAEEQITYQAMLVDNVSDAIISTNIDSNILSWNKAAERIYGWQQAEVQGKRIRDVLQFGFPTGSLQELLKQLDKNGIWNGESIHHRRDGLPLYISGSVSRIKDSAGKPIGNVAIYRDITLSKKAEEDIRELNAFNTSILENAPNPIIVHNTDTSIRYVNPAFEALTGFTAAEVIGKKPPYPHWPDEMIPGYQEKIDSNASNLDNRKFDRHFKKKKGTPIWVEVTATPIRNETGKAIYYLSMWTDMTERRKTEEQIRYQAMLVDNVSDAIISTTLDDIIVSWNKAAEKVYGWQQAEVIGKNIYEVLRMTPHVRRSPLKTIDSYKKTGFWTGDSAHQRRDGVVLNISSSICMIKDPSGKPIGNVGIFRDITEQKKAEEKLKNSESKLRESDERFQQIALNAGEWIWEIDGKGTFLYSNPVVKDILGYSPGELIGKVGFFDLVPEEIRKDLATKFTVGQISQPIHDFVYPCIHRSGKQVILEANIIPILNQDGDTLGSRGVSTDITERTQAAEKLEDLYQKEKKQRQELQEEARARGMFIDVLAHELRTPLTPVLASTGMLKELNGGKTDDIRSRLTDNIFNSTQTLAHRLEELLDLARYSRGTFKLNIQPTDLDKFIRDMLVRFRPSLLQKRQKLIEEIQENLPEAEFDSSRLEQVIINLLSNASKFSKTEGTIFFRAVIDGQQLQVDVKDTGAGILPESQARLFQPYHRVEQDRQQLPGLGLGLAVAKQIVEAHGGKIWLVSQPGQGSTFSFRIPLIQK